MGTSPTCTTCNSESVASANSTALRAASSASSEPSVASRILVGKMLIATLSFPVGTHRGTCVDCIKRLVRRKAAEMARRRPRRAIEAYSPECVEKEEFSEVRGYKLPRLALALYQSRRYRATFGPLPRP